jgi:beta-glucanase (GH16 family)
VNTRGLFEFLYGRVEVRAKLPAGNGTWPAIWMLGTSIGQVGWPTCGEIDVMENVGFEPTRIHGTVHTAAYNHVAGTAKGASVTVASPWEDFHVYAAEWYADRIDVFVDGQKYFTFRNEGTGSRTWPFDKPHYVLLNLAIGGSWGGQKGIDDSRFPHRYLVDYARVYQQR